MQVAYPGASPEEVETGAALVIEEAVRGLDGIKEVRSSLVEGGGVVAIELRLGKNADQALSDIKSAVDRITSFPQDMERPVVALGTYQKQVLALVIHGDKTEHALRQLAEKAREGLLADPDISYVELDAVRTPEISVEVPGKPLRLQPDPDPSRPAHSGGIGGFAQRWH